jgi:hypothetical protein
MAAVDFVELILETVQGNENTAPTLATQKLYLPARTARLSPAPAHLSRADELRSVQGEPPRLIEAYAPGGALSERAYWKDLTWLLELAGFVGTVTPGGALVTDPNSTTATGVNALNSGTVNVGSTAAFPASGTFILAGATAVTYTGKTATSFTGCGAHPATVGGEAINGNVPATANKWVFSKRDAITAQTAQVRINHKDEAVLLTGNGYAVAGMSLNAAGELSADLAGLYVKRTAVDTTTVPAYASTAIPPLRQGELFLNWIAGGGRPSDFSLAIANGLERVPDFSSAIPSPFPEALEYGDAQVAVTGSIPKRALNANDYDALLNASTFSAMARWRSPKTILATSYQYGLWVEMPACQIVGGDAEDMGNKRRIGASYDWFAAYDETAGYDVRFTLVNDVTSIYA